MTIYKNDLESRTLEFSKLVITICNKLEFNLVNKNIINQVVRSATSIGANYREANETESKKDFRNRIRITKKESKETIYWLKLLVYNNSKYLEEINGLIDEAGQLMKIFAAIYSKSF